MDNKTSKIDITLMHYIFIASTFLILMIGVIIYGNPDSDSYFLVDIGKYIVNNKGLPDTNIWVIHDDFSIIIQQWLCALLNYIFYSIAGAKGLVVLTLLELLITSIVMYKFIKLFVYNKKAICVIQIIASLLLMLYLSTRPYLVTLTLILYEIYILEKYSRNENNKIDTINLYVKLVIIIIIQANYQSASIVFEILMILPYITLEVWKKYSIKEWIINVLKIIGTILLLTGASVINPNGINAITYLIKSASIINSDFIHELMEPTILSMNSIYVIATLCILIINICKKRCEKQYIYLSIGTIILASICYRNAYLIIPSLIMGLSKINEDITLTTKRAYTSKSIAMCIGIMYSLLILLISTFTYEIMCTTWCEDNINASDTKAYEYLETLDKKNIRLFTEFNNGAYFEHKGYRVYIDARPELFQKEINGKEDIYTEYLSVYNGSIDYNEFLEKYNFTHLDVDVYSKLNTFLYYSDEYRLVSESGNFRFYERVGE